MNHYQNIEMQKVVRFWESQRTMTGLNNSDVELWKSKIEFLDTISMQHNVIVFLLDTFRNRFIYMSDKLKILSGVDPSFYLAENGIEFSASRIHPDHMQANLEILKLGVNLLTKHSKNYENNIFCYNFLYKNGNDEYVQVLQKSMILEVDDNGSPTLLLSFGHYVGHIKKHQSIGSVLATPHSITIYNYDHVKNVIGPPVTFSKQEKKIIHLLSTGHDTKSIAKELYISPLTVDKHRRNLIKKTDCIDTTGVVEFAKLINLI